MKHNEDKTNVMRLLDQKKIKYKMHNYADTEAISGTEVANALGQNPEMVFKTLVTVGKTNNFSSGGKRIRFEKSSQMCRGKENRHDKVKGTFRTYRLYSWWMLSYWNEKVFQNNN